jgi:hypothetical protein
MPPAPANKSTVWDESIPTIKQRLEPTETLHDDSILKTMFILTDSRSTSRMILNLPRFIGITKRTSILILFVFEWKLLEHFLTRHFQE